MALRQRINVKTSFGLMLFGALTSSYQAVVSNIQGRVVSLIIFNTLNQPIALTFNGQDGGATDFMRIPAGISPGQIILGANNVEFWGTISAKHLGVAPTSGELSISVIRSE